MNEARRKKIMIAKATSVQAYVTAVYNLNGDVDPLEELKKWITEPGVDANGSPTYD